MTVVIQGYSHTGAESYRGRVIRDCFTHRNTVQCATVQCDCSHTGAESYRGRVIRDCFTHRNTVQCATVQCDCSHTGAESYRGTVIRDCFTHRNTVQCATVQCDCRVIQGRTKAVPTLHSKCIQIESRSYHDWLDLNQMWIRSVHTVKSILTSPALLSQILLHECDISMTQF